MSCAVSQPGQSFPLSSEPRNLPSELRGFRGYHAGENIVVCGCGSSLNQLVSPERFITIGVNDVGRLFQPDYLVVLNPRQQFRGDRFRFVEESRAAAIFTQLDLGIRHPHIVRFRLGKFGGVDFSDPTSLHYTRNSPYLAVCLAAHMGAKRIGLIGVDFTDDHFFARTGQHPLTREFAQIDREYRALHDSCARSGIELVNLSEQSRLTALPKISAQQFARAAVAPEGAAKFEGRKVFFVHYKFLSCGDVFRDGLSSAADDLNLTHEGAYWDDPALAEKVRRFAPDLLFVVHGRRFSQRWKNAFKQFRSALWLLDEPYEVDDTAGFSRLFDTVLVNDPATLHRHRNAFYLPVCYDPSRYFYNPGSVRKHDVGFIGGYNPLREQLLDTLANRGLLSYVAGGPWRKRAVQAASLSNNVPAEQTAELYRNTRIILNVFRTEHHFNRQALSATSLNPRIYEGAACGGLVISEDRPEAGQICPSLPVFSNPDELASLVEEFLHDPARYHDVRKDCVRQLARHTYAQRLHTTLNLIFDKEAPIMTSAPAPVSAPAEAAQAKFSILMAVHNARAMTQLATLKTLQHSGPDARLIVVDNASTDGTQEWLQLLAQRGDIQLITNKSNTGHGPALEQARRATTSPYIITLDSDAFPLSGDWLQRLCERLTGAVKLAGIRHHRDYIHPSCLAVERATLDQFRLSFLDEKGRPSQFDVAERISHEIRRRGFQISGLEQTSSLRRGSISEPVDLGAEYSGIVHHQWYTTRSAMAAGTRVDDVPNEAIERSLQEVFEAYHAEPREVAVIMGVRAGAGDADRLRNAKACLKALNLQDLERWRYRIIVVEQDSEPRLESDLAPLADRYLFAYNPGPYNRSWAFNVGACAAASSKALCLIDADLLVGPGFLSACLKKFEAGQRALRPYSEVAYLDASSTEQAIQERVSDAMGPFAVQHYNGRLFQQSIGGCIWVEPGLYHRMSGHDERFRGWGDEDFEFWRRLVAELKDVQSLPGRLAHLHHQRPQMDDSWAAANYELRQKLVGGRVSNWTGPMGNLQRYAGERPEASNSSAPGRRDWENWHRWDSARIDSIVSDEAQRPVQSSIRWRIAQIVRSLGQSMLDVGCGPGPLWCHLEAQRESFTWMGVDATPEMLNVANKRFPHVPLLHADSGSLPLQDGSFDVVLLRHLLEHVPADLMESSVAEAARVAKRALVLAFHVAPNADRRSTHRLAAGFLETQWTENDIKKPITKAGWRLDARFNVTTGGNEQDEVWVVVPQSQGDPPHFEGSKISIIMPTFRRSHTILRTVQTVQAQTYRNWELILVDNAGDGNYWFADPRIQVHRYCERSSASYARNQGLRHASGELVCFFDDDDEMFPTYLERFVAAFQSNPRAKMVRCGMLLAGGAVNFSHATPECCVRREYATDTWDNRSFAHDQHYFTRILAANRWSEQRGDILLLREALCRANSDPHGGLRNGRL